MGRQRTDEELAYHREYMKKFREKNLDEQRVKEKEQRDKLRSDPDKHEAYKTYQREYQSNNKERLAKKKSEYLAKKRQDPEFCEQNRKRQLFHYYALRDAAYEAYGGKRCVCCGETTEQFLSIDHVHNDGAKHRREEMNGSSTAIYRWLKKNGYPPGFQVLCMNCNFGKARNGGICPHISTVKEQ